MRRHLLLLMVLGTLAPASLAQSSGIVPLEEPGRKIYVDAEASNPTSNPSQPPKRASVLMYWSRVEQRWKPVPPPTASAMRAARSAAAECDHYIAAAPPSPVMNAAEASPDNREMLQGRELPSTELDSII